VHDLTDLRAGVAGRKAAVILWMPVLRRDYGVEGGEDRVNDRHYGIAHRDRESATGAKVVLNIDNNQCFHNWLPYSFTTTNRLCAVFHKVLAAFIARLAPYSVLDGSARLKNGEVILD
jgi:hypothetical protein